MNWSPQNFKLAKVFESDGAISNLDFHREGRLLVSSSTESSIQVMDSLQGSEWKKVLVKDHKSM